MKNTSYSEKYIYNIIQNLINSAYNGRGYKKWGKL